MLTSNIIATECFWRIKKTFVKNERDCKLIFMWQLKKLSYFNIYKNVVPYLFKFITINGWRYSRMDQVEFVEDSL